MAALLRLWASDARQHGCFSLRMVLFCILCYSAPTFQQMPPTYGQAPPTPPSVPYNPKPGETFTYQLVFQFSGTPPSNAVPLLQAYAEASVPGATVAVFVFPGFCTFVRFIISMVSKPHSLSLNDIFVVYCMAAQGNSCM